MMIRILFVWAVQNPESAYVQGINDLCAPLLLVFLSEYVVKADLAEEALHQQSKRPFNQTYFSQITASMSPKQPRGDKTNSFNSGSTDAS